MCVRCGAGERHRLAWLFFERRTDLFSRPGIRMLHVAPEPYFQPRLRRKLGANYMTADLSANGVDVRMDVTNISFPDETFDVIYCSHVLEHVSDDRKAMREFRRVLTSDGWAVLLVPVIASKTFEDPMITDPDERLRVYGQSDHVRIYGPDYLDRLEESGFVVTRFQPHKFLSAAEIETMGITAAAGDVYYCKKGK